MLEVSHALCELLWFGLCNRQNQLIKKSLNRQVKNFVNRQSQIYIKSRASIYVFNLPKHFALSVRFDLNNTTLAKFSNRVNKKNHFVHLFFNLDEKLNKINDLRNKLFFDNVLLCKKRSKNNDLVQTVTKKLQ